MSSVEYPATVAGVKQGLKATECSQRRAALATKQSVALVSMVLAEKAKSQPCLDKLAVYLNRLAKKNSHRGVHAPSVA